MELNQAIELVKSAGYRVSKPKAKAPAPKLNALGLPMSPLYDPNYRRRASLTPISRLYAPMGKHTQWASEVPTNGE